VAAVAAAISVAASIGAASAVSAAEPDAVVEPVASGETVDTLTGEPLKADRGPVEVRIPLSEHAESVKVALPEMRCPPAAPYVWDMRFHSKTDPPVAFPGGLQPDGNAERVAVAKWADHIRDDQGLGIALAKGSVLELTALAPGVTATFRLYCTGDPGMAVGLGAVPDPAPIELGSSTRQQLELPAGTWIEGTTGLPAGLALSRDGVLSGAVPLGAAGDTVVRVRLTNGRVGTDRGITVRTIGKVVQRVSRSWDLPNQIDERGTKNLGEFLCPPAYPWTTKEVFHGPLSLQQVPNGVRAVTHGGLVEVMSRGVWADGLSRGLTAITAANTSWSGNAAIHFSLDCTNDANRAGRR
jgi:hypothetical protein